MKYLIVGLGNIGSEYANTRHNIGFKLLDAIVEASNTVFKQDRLAYVAEIKVKGRTLVLIKPTTYMNLSGKAVNYWLQKEKIPVENLLVITDDIALPFGSIRIRQKGSDGGHNGLKDIIAVLGGDKFSRIRFGVGSDFGRGGQVDYVLGEWSKEEDQEMQALLDHCFEAVKGFATIGIERTMNFYNKKK